MVEKCLALLGCFTKAPFLKWSPQGSVEGVQCGYDSSALWAASLAEAKLAIFRGCQVILGSGPPQNQSLF